MNFKNVKKFLIMYRKLFYKVLAFSTICMTLIFFECDSMLSNDLRNYLGSNINEVHKSFHLENILNNIELDKSRNIFFVESSFSATKDEVSLNYRQACSIESAAFMNQKAHICVVFVTNSRLIHSDVVESLMEYPNIAFYRLDLPEFSLNTTVEAWIKGKAIYEYKFPVETISDIVRLLLLWR